MNIHMSNFLSQTVLDAERNFISYTVRIQESTTNLFIQSAWLHDHAKYLTLFHQLKNKVLQMLKSIWRQSYVRGLNQKERQKVHKEQGHLFLLL